MYIPIAHIPGCRPHFENGTWWTRNPLANVFDYEPDPRETVVIRLSSLPTHEAVAEFYAYIAYPDPTEVTQRKKYSVALSRWAVLERGKFDKEWNQSTDNMIRPIIFSQPENLFLKTYRRGSLIWWRRAQFAFMMLLPDLVDKFFGGLPYTAGNVALVAGGKFGYSTGSQKTVELRIWRPTKPVAHAAAAIMLCFGLLDDPKHGWDDEHKLCQKQKFLATLFYPDVFESLILFPAEYLRLQLPSCERFQIRENDTVRFIWN